MTNWRAAVFFGKALDVGGGVCPLLEPLRDSTKRPVAVSTVTSTRAATTP